MCGISGIIGKNNREAVQRMIFYMKHRGPNDEGVFCDNKISLGMCRLSILDTSPAGHQPMCNDTGGIWIIYNGEMYNFLSEKEKLINKGYKFKSNSDTEVILKMYESYGEDFLLNIRGMFTLAIYDKRQGIDKAKVILARDQFGIKPLLYSYRNGVLIFASEIKAMLASGLIKKEIDRESLRLLLTFGSITQPRTILKDVSMLLPGHKIIITKQQFQIKKYWSLASNKIDFSTMSNSEIVEFTASKLKECVKLHMVSDVPIGAFLSGGIDSSLLVSLLAKESKSSVKTFSVSFGETDPSQDESQDALRIAQYLGTNHSTIKISNREITKDISKIAKGLDQPTIDGVNSYVISKAARQFVTVAISGTGGDELFAGYPWFIQMLLYQHRNHENFWKFYTQTLIGRILQLKIFNPLLNCPMGSTIFNLRNIGSFRSYYSSLHSIFTPPDTSRILIHTNDKNIHFGNDVGFDQAQTDELPKADPINRVSALCIRGYLKNQLLRDIDAASMAHSLEIRVPYIDTVISEIAFSLPSNLKLGNIVEMMNPLEQTYKTTGAKKILVEINKKYLPFAIDQQKKRGFSLPFGHWLKTDLHETLKENLSPETIKKRGLFNFKEVRVVLDDFSNNRISWPKPWLLMMLELWIREVLENKYE